MEDNRHKIIVNGEALKNDLIPDIPHLSNHRLMLHSDINNQIDRKSWKTETYILNLTNSKLFDRTIQNGLNTILVQRTTEGPTDANGYKGNQDSFGIAYIIIHWKERLDEA
jgi:hypothetical protein